MVKITKLKYTIYKWYFRGRWKHEQNDKSVGYNLNVVMHCFCNRVSIFYKQRKKDGFYF